jgi:hypothetical protein
MLNRKGRHGLRVAATLLCWGVLCPGWGAAQASDELFETKVRPLLVEKCQRCHGPEKQWAELRLDSAEALAKGGESGPVLVPGKPDESELMARVAAEDGSLRMPPEEEGPALGAEQIAALRQWIAEGAHWPKSEAVAEDARAAAWRTHWAFQPVVRAAVPEVSASSWVRNPIDAFVAQRLERAGLQPTPEADRRTLIRRATFDLTGLPPSAEEAAAFVQDEAPDAYERLIDRLLASPRYGEQWGRHWLDVARYADSKGYVYAREERFFVNSSLYRDWVIRATNEDLPYDRFVKLQLAADQLAEDPRDLAAMGFLTLGRRFLGVPGDIIDDRIDVVSRGLLGLTVGCARCHDHKYDPIPTADYYSLYGVFANCYESRVTVPRAPGMAEPTAEFLQGFNERTQKLTDETAASRKQLEEHIRTHIPQYLLAQRELEKYPELAFNLLTNFGDELPGIVRRWEAYLATGAKQNEPVFAIWRAFAALPEEGFAEKASEVTAQIQSGAIPASARVARAFAEPPATLNDVAERYGTIFSEVEAAWKAHGEQQATAGAVTPALPDAEQELLRQVLYGAGSPCVVPDEPLVSTEYYWDTATVVKLWGLQADLDRWVTSAPDAIPQAVILTDRNAPVEQCIFRRGDPANRGAEVPRQFLQVLAGKDRKPFEKGSGRRELAEAIVAPNNPLTARVWVNRIWAQHFGAGLVTTPSDFGMRATPPSHPELLDWLASEFVESGWSNKRLHKLLMTSATYRQGSRSVSDETRQLAQQLDPEDRLLWRMQPRRLRFEPYRDSLLAYAGELDLAMGGKGTDLFSARRSVYTQVDRQFLPNVLSMFDFANPDLHAPQRAESTIPQQALFALNHPFVAARARALAARGERIAPSERIARLYWTIYQREPTPEEREAAEQFVTGVVDEPAVQDDSAAAAWSYGYGPCDEASGRVTAFTPLPHFTGTAWQGGAAVPDSALGWVYLTAHGGHPGNDPQHAAIRRWTAPADCEVTIKSEIVHEAEAGNGIQGWIVSSRDGILGSAAVDHGRAALTIKSVHVQRGDTLDFVADIAGELNSDQFLWPVSIRVVADAATSIPLPATQWQSVQDFRGPLVHPLSPWEQLAQLLLISNEAMFVD